MTKFTEKEEMEIRKMINKVEKDHDKAAVAILERGAWPEDITFKHLRYLRGVRAKIRKACSTELYAYLTDIIEENESQYRLYAAINEA